MSSQRTVLGSSMYGWISFSLSFSAANAIISSSANLPIAIVSMVFFLAAALDVNRHCVHVTLAERSLSTIILLRVLGLKPGAKNISNT
jgi:hypothetical protein